MAVPDVPAPGSPDPDPSAQTPKADGLPQWFCEFLSDRHTRKPSVHSMKAYRQDFVAIASLVGSGDPADFSLADITRDTMRAAFAAYAREHEAASIRRCWSTWNVLCTFLYTGERLAANPMSFVGRPKLPKSLPKSLPLAAVEALLSALADDQDAQRATDWPERDRAIILTALLSGLRADELRRIDVGDIRTTGDGAAVIHVKGKGGRERSVPIEAELLGVIDHYLRSRAIRLPDRGRQRSVGKDGGLATWPHRAPLFVGRDGERITRGTLQSRVKRAFTRAGPDAQPVAGALVHGLRHTYATELASSDVNVYTLMKLLGHESMTTSQRYVTAAGSETRSAAARNPLYGMIDAADSHG